MLTENLSPPTTKKSPKIPLRYAIVIPFVLQIVGAVSLVGYLSFKNGQKAIEDLVNQLMFNTGNRIQERLDSYLATPHHINAINANAVQNSQLDLANFPQLQRLFWQKQQIFPSITSICFTSSQGEIIWTEKESDGSFLLSILKANDRGNLRTFTLNSQGNIVKQVRIFPNYRPLQRPWYTQAKAAGKPTWTSIYPWIVEQTVSLAAIQPLYEASGKLIGVFSVDLSLSDISKFLHSLKISPSGQTFIMERSGEIVATSSLEKPYITNSNQKYLTRLKAVNSSIELTRITAKYLTKNFTNLSNIQTPQQLKFIHNGKAQFVRVNPYKDKYGLDWLIVIVVPEDDFMAQINANTNTTIWLCLGAFIIAVSLGIGTARWIALPLWRLSKASQAIAKGELNQNVAITNINELAVLARSFNQMSQQLQQYKTELENYSHSLEKQVNQRTDQLQQEIRDRQLLENKLRSSEAEVRAFFEAMTDIVLMIDAEKQNVKAAPTNYQKLYHSHQDVLSLTIDKFFLDEHSETFWHQVRQALDTQEIINFEYSLIVDKQTIWFASSISPTSENIVAWVARDISDRKQAEEALKISEERWQLALQGNNDGIWDWNLKTGEIFYSSRWKEMLGYQDWEIANNHDEWVTRVHPEDYELATKAWEAHINQTTPYYVAEYRLRCKDGSYKWILDRGKALWDEQAKPIRMVGSHTDITDRKQREEALQLIVEGTAAKTGKEFFHDCVRYLAQVLKVRYAIVTELVGSRQNLETLPFLNSKVLPLAFWTGETWSDEIEYDFINTPCETVLTGTTCFYPDNIPDRFPEDRYLIDLGVVSYLGIPMFDSTGKVLGHLAVLDIKPMERDPGRELILRIFAARAGAELERQQAEEIIRKRSITDSMLSSISRAFLDRDIDTAINFTLQVIGEFTNSDRSYIIRYSETPNQMTNTHEWCATNIEPSIDKLQAIPIQSYPWVNRQILQGNIVQIPCIAELPPEANQEKTEFEYQSIKSIIKLPINYQGKVIGLIGLDTIRYSKKWTDEEINLLKLVGEIIAIGIARSQAEIAQQQAAQTAFAANRAKSEFLANMSHELRTPLTAILGLSEVLRDEVFGPLTAKQHQKLATIEQSGQHLLELINDVLDLAKIESGKLELQLDPTDIQGLCEGSLAFVRQQAHQKQIKLSSHIPPRIGKVVVDERRMRQVLINLLSNAVKFTPEGGEVWIEVQIDREHEVIHFSIVDTGIGIAPEDIGKLFQPFMQLDSSFTRRYKGTGLGLALVRQVVELHSGSVALQSEIDRGSRFTVSLPWKPETLSLSSTPTVSSPQINLAHNLQRVLIVEDSPPAAEQVARYLQELGVPNSLILSLGTGTVEEALRMKPDAIILDLQLPDRSGWDVLSQLKANPQTQDIPILIISVVDEPGKAEEWGVAAYIVKPFSRSQFQIAWRKFLLFHQRSIPSTVPQEISSPLILLAEDNETNLSTIVEYLEVKGYRVAIALNGREAVQLNQELHPDLILMDIQMPEMDGLEATRQIRSIGEELTNPSPRVPIIALTSLAMPGDREKCLAAGVDEYLAKPVSLKKLVQAIEHYLNQAKS
ncbi:MAG TPA: response regulator [Leptolyngbyaceae cyanobacterium]